MKKPALSFLIICVEDVKGFASAKQASACDVAGVYMIICSARSFTDSAASRRIFEMILSERLQFRSRNSDVSSIITQSGVL